MINGKKRDAPDVAARDNRDDANAAAGDSRVKVEPWGALSDGTAVSLYTLRNRNGMKVSISSYAATMTAVVVASASGSPVDVLLGYAELEPYVALRFGQLIGRYANRIAAGRFRIDGESYQLSVNTPPHTLHGGFEGFNRKVWKGEAQMTAYGPTVAFSHTSPDGDEGFPGTLIAEVSYTLTDDDAIRIEYKASTDKPTIVNLTNHAYWNLDGAGSGSVLGERLTVNADRYTPTDAASIPTGAIESVADTPLDFRNPTPLGLRLVDGVDAKFHIEHGYDNNFVINRTAPGELVPAARLEAESTGIVMDVETTEPGLQLYTGNWLKSGKYVGNGGRSYRAHDAVALECEAFPDSPNHSGFPDTVLRPGQTYRQTTIYRFSRR